MTWGQYLGLYLVIGWVLAFLGDFRIRGLGLGQRVSGFLSLFLGWLPLLIVLVLLLFWASMPADWRRKLKLEKVQ